MGSLGASDPNWWRQACVYQIYPRSFSDANGDGIGDMKGITSKVPYLKELGVDAVWLSPFYPSPLKDGGYDVCDYRDVDPKIGSLADFDEMAQTLKEAGIKVIVDIVPNHSSVEHEWFQEALRSPIGSNARERYIFRDGTGPDMSQPPSDWHAVFGGSAWEAVGDGQYYLHLFDTSQPDFNWDHQEVRDDFLKTLRFWADRSVSGFRVDVAHGMVKDVKGDLPTQTEIHKLMMDKLKNGSISNSHPFWDREEIHDIYKDWRKLFDEYDPPLTAVAEAWVASDRKHLYASPEGLGQSFSFDMLMLDFGRDDFGRDDFRQTIDSSLADSRRSGSSTTWVLSNHDVPRHASRYGLPKGRAMAIGDDLGQVQFCHSFLLSRGKDPKCDYELGLHRARAGTLLLLALPGCTYLYQGEELGLPEVLDIPDSAKQDPCVFRNPGKEAGRDGCRVPIPWTKSGTNFGFGSGKAAHLPMSSWMGDYSVEAESDDAESTLNLYRTALRLRRELQGAEELEWIGDEKETLHFRRPGGWEVFVNFDGEGVKVPQGKKVLISSAKIEGGIVPKNTTVWLKA